ncbi:MAG: hypothetical protein KA801_06490 [Syntrophorhabdaceae bacterium]|nr:hypothetical protein [Syntrophorhabdaceae bacterium]
MSETVSDKRADLILNKLRGDFRTLAVIIGIDNALRISAEFGGITIHIPKLHSLCREERDARIREAYDKGISARKLATIHGLTQRRIYAILKGNGE